MNGHRLVTKDSETRTWIACVRELEREQHPREGRGRW